VKHPMDLDVPTGGPHELALNWVNEVAAQAVA
jgi:hypothetical protein